jgi:hypothetical protein
MASLASKFMVRFGLPLTGLAAARWLSFSKKEPKPLPEDMVEVEHRVVTYEPDEPVMKDMESPSAPLLLESVKEDVGLPLVLSSSKKCPTIERPTPGLLKRLVKLLGGNDCMLISDSTSSHHVYMYLVKGPTYEEIASHTGLSKKQVKQLLMRPHFYPFLFSSAMIGGGAQVEPGPSKQSVGLELTPARDPIELSRVTMELYVPSISMPRSHSDPTIKFCSSMLAQTRYGHALSGSVLHTLFGDNERLYFMWIGAGGGVPVIGGGLNNVVACREEIGIWPMLTKNYKGFLTHPEIMPVAYNLFDDNLSPSARAAMLAKIQRMAQANEEWQPYLASYLAVLPDAFGLRLGSSMYGHLKGKPGQTKD